MKKFNTQQKETHQAFKKYLSHHQVKVNTSPIDFELTPQMLDDSLLHHADVVDQIDSFYFNIFEFQEVVGRNMVMPIIATHLLKKNNLQSCVDFSKFLKFISEIYNSYLRSVAYHNDLHGADVAQHVNLILSSQGLMRMAQFNNVDTLSLLVASLCHDVGHDGFNNRYHVVS